MATPYFDDIEQATLANDHYRNVVYTNDNLQIALMALLPGESIPLECHSGSQFIRVEAGNGRAIIDGVEHMLEDGIALVVPPHTEHVIYADNNPKQEMLKLYSIYSPPEHEAGTVDYEQP